MWNFLVSTGKQWKFTPLIKCNFHHWRRWSFVVRKRRCEERETWKPRDVKLGTLRLEMVTMKMTLCRYKHGNLLSLVAPGDGGKENRKNTGSFSYVGGMMMTKMGGAWKRGRYLGWKCWRDEKGALLRMEKSWARKNGRYFTWVWKRALLMMGVEKCLSLVWAWKRGVTKDRHEKSFHIGWAWKKGVF